MLANRNESFDVLLQRARGGDTVAIGCLLDSCHTYLKLMAASLLRTASHASVDVSDVVQETNLKACLKFTTFNGSDERALVGWLRKILKNHVLNLLENQGRPGRRPGSLEVLLERAGEEVHQALAASGSTPSAHASRREQAVLTANALGSLPVDYQQVLILRFVETVPHREIARRMGRTEGASRELLSRAAKALKKKLQEEP